MATNLPKYQATRKDYSSYDQTSYDQSRLGSQSHSDQGNLARDEEEAPAKTLPEKSTDGGEFDWRKTGAIPKGGVGGDQSKALLTAKVSPREVQYDQNHHIDEAGDSQANSDATGNSGPTDHHPISTAQLPTSNHSAIDNFIADSGTSQISGDAPSSIFKTTGHFQQPLSSGVRRDVLRGRRSVSVSEAALPIPVRHFRRFHSEGAKDEIAKLHGGKLPVVYGGAAKVEELAKRLRKLKFTDASKLQGSQDGVLMTKEFVARGGQYRDGHEFKQGQVLGTGAHSELVITIHDSTSGAVAAGKIVTLEHFAPDEAIIWCRLIHDNITRLFGLIRTGGTVMFLSEYDRGYETLQRRVDQCMALGQGQAVEVFEQLLEALAFLHEKKIIHRDVYPSNILVKTLRPKQNYGEQVKLIDFGIARKLIGAVHVEGETSGLGNAAYRAPEIERGESYDERVDVWSAICTLMCLLKGIAPWSEKGIKEYPSADIPTSTDRMVRDLVEQAHKVDQYCRPRAQEVLERCKNIPRDRVQELYNIPASAAEPPMDSSSAELGDSNESLWSDDSSDGPVRGPPADPQQAAPEHDDIGAGDARPHGPDGPVHGQPADPQLDEETLTHSQPAPVHDDIGAGDARLHGPDGPVHGPPADPQLDEETLTNNQPAPVHDDIGAGDARPHGPDGPVRGPSADPQLVEETLTHNQPAPVHDDVGAGDVRPHGVKGIFVTVKDEGCEDMKIKLPPGLNSVICVAGAFYEEIKTTPFTLHEMNGGALGRGHTFRSGNHTLVAVPAPDGGDWPWRMPASGKVEYA